MDLVNKIDIKLSMCLHLKFIFIILQSRPYILWSRSLSYWPRVFNTSQDIQIRREEYQLKMASQLEKKVGSEYYLKERIQEFLDMAMDLVSHASGCVKEALSKRDKNVETKVQRYRPCDWDWQNHGKTPCFQAIAMTFFGILHINLALQNYSWCSFIPHKSSRLAWKIW